MIDPIKWCTKSICTILDCCPLPNALCSVCDTQKRRTTGTLTFPINKLFGWKRTTELHKSSKTNRHQELNQD